MGDIEEEVPYKNLPAGFNELDFYYYNADQPNGRNFFGKPEEVEPICLQTEISQENKVLLERFGIRCWDEFLHNFSDTAALIANMDLIITVDTSVAHLAGALGVKTWVLINEVPDHRWFLDTGSSPWYPSITLYRQPTYGDWTAVVEKVHCDLKLLCSSIYSDRTTFLYLVVQ